MTRSQDLWFAFLLVSMTLAIIWVTWFAPESPQFLLSKRRFDDLEKSLSVVAKFNGCYDEELIKEIVEDLKLQNQITTQIDDWNDQFSDSNSMSLWKNKTNRHNLLATCYLWASSGFIGYLIAYYSKYFKGSVFVNFTMSGLSDALSMIYAAFLTSRFSLQTSILIFYILLIILSILMTVALDQCSEEMALLLVPFFVLAIRLQSSALQNYGY